MSHYGSRLHRLNCRGQSDFFNRLDYFWDTMPLDRKLLLFGGLLLILLWRRVVHGIRAVCRSVPGSRLVVPGWRGAKRVATLLMLIPGTNGPAPHSGSGENGGGRVSPSRLE